jgi:hypothetical protein
MTDRRSAGLSEFTWYSRLAAWIGAAMLLVQSVLGRDAGPVTVLAVLLLGIGFLCFLVGLAMDSHVRGTELLVGSAYSQQGAQEVRDEQSGPSAPVLPTSVSVDVAASAAAAPDSPKRETSNSRRAAKANSAPTVSGPARRPKFRERAKRADARPTDRTETEPEVARPVEDYLEHAVTPVDTSSGSVRTETMTAASPPVGSDCPRCEDSLQVGQLAATCPVCGRAHHAVCWMEHHFHCAVPECTGHGSLEAPQTTTAQDEP